MLLTNYNIMSDSDFESVSSGPVEGHYDMNVLEEYMSLFGNPFAQTTKLIIENVKGLKWPKEEIVSLFEEMLDETYENLMEEDDQFNIYMAHNKIVEFDRNIKILKEENDS